MKNQMYIHVYILLYFKVSVNLYSIILASQYNSFHWKLLNHRLNKNNKSPPPLATTRQYNDQKKNPLHPILSIHVHASYKHTINSTLNHQQLPSPSWHNL